MITCSAPGKICLFGEHGIVYGMHSIACSINQRAYVSIYESNEIKQHIKIKNKIYYLSKNPYITSVLKNMENLYELNLKNISIIIDSNIPICSGLGSSSAVIVSLIKCIDKYYNLNIDLNEIAYIGYLTEKYVQGIASPMDTYVSTYGGTVIFPEKKKIKFFDNEIIICNSLDKSNTKEIVNNVRLLKKKYPLIISNIFNTMDFITIEGKKAIENNELKKIGELMNINQGLLDSINVNSKNLSNLVYKTRLLGSFGSKITGSGGGGCVISLFDNNVDKEKIVNYFNSIGYSSFICNTTNYGVRNETK